MSTMDAPAVFSAKAVPGQHGMSRRNPDTIGVSTMSSPLPSESFLPVVFPAGRVCASLLGGAALAALIALGAPGAAQAQTATVKPAPAKQASIDKQASVAKKPPVAKRSGKKAVEPVPEPEVEVAAADDQQLLAAKEVLLGESGCEFDQKIQVDASAKHPGYVDMSFNKKKYTMKPVLSPTGALRLEDVRREALMIQIASKTMVMNQKTGQRLVDNCVHPDQRTVSADSGNQVLMK